MEANTLPATDFTGSFPVDAFAKAPVGFSVLLQALPLPPEDASLLAFEFVDIVFRTKRKTKRQSEDESSQISAGEALLVQSVECAESLIILFFSLLLHAAALCCCVRRRLFFQSSMERLLGRIHARPKHPISRAPLGLY